MSTLLDPNRRALDLTGAVMSGAKLYTYATGSSTPLATYQDEARTVANTNPVVADANGFFPRMYGTPTSLYRLVLKTSADVTIRTEDNVASLESSASSAAARLKQLVACPLDYGAVGDGVADDRTALQAAITASLGVVDLAGKTYKCSGGLTLKSGIEIRNGAITASGTQLFLATGTDIIASTPLTANCLVGVGVVDIGSTTGAAVGDLVILQASYAMGGASNRIGEVATVASVSSPTVLILGETIANEHGYLTAESAVLVVARPMTNVKLSRLTLTAGATTEYLLQAINCAGIVVEDCEITSAYTGKYGAIQFRDCYRCFVSRTNFSTSLTGNCMKGVSIEGGSRDCVVLKCKFLNCGKASINDAGAVRIGNWDRHGQPISTTVEGCTFRDCSHSVCVQSLANRVIVDGCDIRDEDSSAVHYGVYSAGLNVVVRNCRIHTLNQLGYGGGFAFYSLRVDTNTSTFRDDSQVLDCQLFSNNAGGYSIVFQDETYGTERSATIRNVCGVPGAGLVNAPRFYADKMRSVTIADCFLSTVYLRDCINSTIGGCVIMDPSATALVQLAYAATVSHCTISRCSFGGAAYVHGILNASGAAFSVSNCEFTDGDGTGTAIESENAGDMIDSCVFSGNFLIGVDLGARATVRGCTFGSLAAIGTGIKAVVGPAIVDGCQFGSATVGVGCGIAIQFDNMTRGIISNNQILGRSTSAHHLIVLGSAGGACTYVAVKGNVVRFVGTGAYNIINAAVPNMCIFSDNIFYRDDDAAACIACTGANPNRCVFNGNIFSNGTYGIDYTTGLVGIADGNSFVGMATANTVGAGLTVGDFV